MVGDLHAVHLHAFLTHHADGKYLFADGLAVPEVHRDDELQQQIGEQDAQGSDEDHQLDHHVVDIKGLFILGDGFGGGFDDGFGMDFGFDSGMQMQFGLEEETTDNGEEGIFTNEIVVLQTAKGMFLRFPLREIPEKKKGAIGVRGIKLDKDDYITDVYVLDAGDNLEVDFKGKKVELRKLKTTKRDGKGTKVR